MSQEYRRSWSIGSSVLAVLSCLAVASLLTSSCTVEGPLTFPPEGNGEPSDPVRDTPIPFTVFVSSDRAVLIRDADVAGSAKISVRPSNIPTGSDPLYYWVIRDDKDRGYLDASALDFFDNDAPSSINREEGVFTTTPELQIRGILRDPTAEGQVIVITLVAFERSDSDRCSARNDEDGLPQFCVMTGEGEELPIQREIQTLSLRIQRPSEELSVSLDAGVDGATIVCNETGNCGLCDAQGENCRALTLQAVITGGSPFTPGASITCDDPLVLLRTHDNQSKAAVPFTQGESEAAGVALEDYCVTWQIQEQLSLSQSEADEAVKSRVSFLPLAPDELEAANEAAEVRRKISYLPPLSRGTATVTVNVRDADGQQVTASLPLVVAERNQLRVATLTSNVQQIAPGDSTVVNIAADGGLPPFAIEVSNAASSVVPGKFAPAGGSCDDATDTFTCAEAACDVQFCAPHGASGTASIRVEVTDGINTQSVSSLPIIVASPRDLDVNLNADNLQVRPGGTLGLTASVIGGSPPYQVCFDLDDDDSADGSISFQGQQCETPSLEAAGQVFTNCRCEFGSADNFGRETVKIDATFSAKPQAGIATIRVAVLDSTGGIATAGTGAAPPVTDAITIQITGDSQNESGASQQVTLRQFEVQNAPTDVCPGDTRELYIEVERNSGEQNSNNYEYQMSATEGSLSAGGNNGKTIEFSADNTATVTYFAPSRPQAGGGNITEHIDLSVKQAGGSPDNEAGGQIALTLKPRVEVTRIDNTTAVCAGQGGTITIAEVGDNATYDWSVVNEADCGSAIAGDTTSRSVAFVAPAAGDACDAIQFVVDVQFPGDAFDSCGAGDDFTVTVNPLPDVTIQDESGMPFRDGFVCEGRETIAYVVPEAGFEESDFTYDWDLLANGSINGLDSGSTLSFNPGDPGEDIALQVFVTNNSTGCDDRSGVANIPVRPTPDVTLGNVIQFSNAVAPDNEGIVRVCAEGPFSIQATSQPAPVDPATYDWFIVDGTDFIPQAETGDRLTVTPGGPDELITIAVDVTHDGCISDRVTRGIRVKPLPAHTVEPDVNSGLPVPPLCAGTQYTARAVPVQTLTEGVADYIWTIDGLPRPDCTGAECTYTPTGAQVTFQVAVETDSGCTDGGVEETFPVDDPPEAEITAPAFVCGGDDADAAYPGVGACLGCTVDWSVSGCDGVVSELGETDATYSLHFDNPADDCTATVSLSAEEAGTSCASLANADIEVRRTPDPTIAGNALVCPGDDIELSVADAGAGAVYRWFLLPDDVNPLCADCTDQFTYPNVAEGEGPLTFVAEVEKNGCTSARDQLVVNVRHAFDPVIFATFPNAIDPPMTCVGGTTPGDLCQGEMFTACLTGGQGDSGAADMIDWLVNGVPQPQCADLSTCQYTAAESGSTATVVIEARVQTDTGCQDTTMLAVDLEPAPEPEIIVPAAVCTGELAAFSYNNLAGSNTCVGCTFNWTLNGCGYVDAPFGGVGVDAIQAELPAAGSEAVLPCTVTASLSVMTASECTPTAEDAMVNVYPQDIQIDVPADVCQGEPGNQASVLDFAAVPLPVGAQFAWTATGASIDSGQGTESISFTPTAGAGGMVLLDVMVDIGGGCVIPGQADVGVLQTPTFDIQTRQTDANLPAELLTVFPEGETREFCPAVSTRLRVANGSDFPNPAVVGWTVNYLEGSTQPQSVSGSDANIILDNDQMNQPVHADLSVTVAPGEGADGCETTSTRSIVINPIPDPGPISGPALVCDDAAAVEYSASATEGTPDYGVTNNGAISESSAGGFWIGTYNPAALSGTDVQQNATILLQAVGDGICPAQTENLDLRRSLAIQVVRPVVGGPTGTFELKIGDSVAPIGPPTPNIGVQAGEQFRLSLQRPVPDPGGGPGVPGVIPEMATCSWSTTGTVLPADLALACQPCPEDAADSCCLVCDEGIIADTAMETITVDIFTGAFSDVSDCSASRSRDFNITDLTP